MIKCRTMKARPTAGGIIRRNTNAFAMPRLNVVLRSGEQRGIDAGSGQSLKEGLMDSGIAEINALSSCGGCCSCGTCQVYLSEADFARLPAMMPSEAEVLSINEERSPTSRLSCQITLTDDLDSLTVTIAPEL
jgi:ferredoxin, 2Fe-2S